MNLKSLPRLCFIAVVNLMALGHTDLVASSSSSTSSSSSDAPVTITCDSFGIPTIHGGDLGII